MEGIRYSLKTSPGNITVTSKFLSMVVASIHRDDVRNLKLDAARSSFAISDLNTVLNETSNGSNMLFLEVRSHLLHSYI